MQESRLGQCGVFPGEGGEAFVKSPFVITAGHLREMEGLFRKDETKRLTPAQVIDQDVELLEQYRNQPWYKIIGSGRRRRLANDGLGTRPEQEIRYRRTGRDFLEQFLALSDDDPVKIANGQRDWWVEGYASHEHTSRYYNLPPFRVMGDSIYIAVFLDRAKELGIEEGKIQTVEETVTYSNRNKPKLVISLLTTAKVVRQVLSDEGFKKEMDQRMRP